VERLAALGLEASFASELEFYLFKGTYAEARESGYAPQATAYHQHADNDVLIAGLEVPFIGLVLQAMWDMGIEVEAWQGEGGEGQHEINLRYTDPIAMADRHVIYKHTIKAIAHQQGRAVTFMAKPWSDRTGSSGHVHISLRDSAGRPALITEDNSLSPLGRHFLGGLLSASPELILLHAPYANSYRRLQPGSWAPCNVTWGHDNRTCMVRLLGSCASFRLEFRLPGADVNPYLSFAAILAAGLHGIEQELDPGQPTVGDAYAQGAPTLPRDLTEALRAFEMSKVAISGLGEGVHSHLLGLANAELNATRQAVSHWEVGRAFENA
jgi:glutamine synthetase